MGAVKRDRWPWAGARVDVRRSAGSDESNKPAAPRVKVLKANGAWALVTNAGTVLTALDIKQLQPVTARDAASMLLKQLNKRGNK